MSLLIAAQSTPLTTDAAGVVRISSTRVTLDTVVAAFRQGMTAEGIVEQYPSVRLADVYFVIGYYLDHQEEVDTYLIQRDQFAAEIRRENESRFPAGGVRDRLLSRHRG